MWTNTTSINVPYTKQLTENCTCDNVFLFHFSDIHVVRECCFYSENKYNLNQYTTHWATDWTLYIHSYTSTSQIFITNHIDLLNNTQKIFSLYKEAHSLPVSSSYNSFTAWDRILANYTSFLLYCIQKSLHCTWFWWHKTTHFCSPRDSSFLAKSVESQLYAA